MSEGLNPERIPFGLADIIIGEGENEVRFDGAANFQAEGGEVTLTPMLEDITVADLGNGVYDQRVSGWEGSVTFVAAEESIEVLELALAAVEPITDAEGVNTTGLMDSRIGTSMRTKAKKVRIHPRQYPADFTDYDINIYKMASTEGLTRSNANEQGNISVTLNMYPRDGMDADKPGNFFFIGGTDPNAGDGEGNN